MIKRGSFDFEFRKRNFSFSEPQRPRRQKQRRKRNFSLSEPMNSAGNGIFPFRGRRGHVGKNSAGNGIFLFGTAEATWAKTAPEPFFFFFRSTATAAHNGDGARDHMDEDACCAFGVALGRNMGREIGERIRVYVNLNARSIPRGVSN